jgi:uncharacterized protein YjiK
MALFDRNRYCKLISLLFLCSIGLGSCQMFWRPHSPNGYVLPHPKKIILDKKLSEISSLFYLKDENAFLTISDDKKKIYRLAPDGQVSDYFEQDIFPEQQDYEDVLKINGVVYALVSNGTILSLKKSDSGLITNQYPFPSGGKNDFETLYYDPSAKGLIMLCKRCASEKGLHQRQAFRFDLVTNKFDSLPLFSVSTDEVKEDLKDGKVEFDPSAAAMHPLDKKLYILSGGGHLLVICEPRGKVDAVYRLNPTFYPQAEGIAFASNGDMYITNEAKLGKPTLLKIVYKPSGNKKR